MHVNRNWWPALIIVAGGLLAALLAAGVYYLYTNAGPKRLSERRILEGPPDILVSSPRDGETFTQGGYAAVSATVLGAHPIARVEIWFDGRLSGTQTPDPPDQTALYPSFELMIPEGVHTLYWRAVDSRGLVGQSQVISVAGVPNASAAGTTEIIAEPGQNLEDIAASRDLDRDSVAALNPNLAQGPLPEGTRVTVPSPADPPDLQDAAVDLAPAAVPQPPAGTSPLLPAQAPLIDLGTLLPDLVSALPVAPAHLQVGLDQCYVRLMWDDRATNEEGFRVWMQPLGGGARPIASLKARQGTGIAWYDLRSPSTGIYSFWVEAVNALGAQPSQVEWVGVDQECGSGVATQLEVQIVRLWGFSGGGWGKPYCYLSAEGWPEKRFPEDPAAWLQVDAAGTTDFNLILVNIPADDVLTLEGDCWSGQGTPRSMGTFSVSVPSEQWDARDLQIQSQNYTIDFRVRPHGSMNPAWGVYMFLDHSIDIPRIDTITVEHSEDPDEQRMLAYRPTISWWWGGPAAITGFSVYVDGLTLAETPLELIDGGVPHFQTTSPFPTVCGGTYKVQVAANVGPARSLLSEPYKYVQPACSAYADLVILGYSFDWFPPEDPSSAECDTTRLETHVVVNDLYRGFASAPTTCGVEYRLDDLKLAHQRGAVPGLPSQYRVALDPADPRLLLKVTWWKPDDQFLAVIEDTIQIPAGQLGSFHEEFTRTDQMYSVDATVHFMISTFQTPQE